MKISARAKEYLVSSLTDRGVAEEIIAFLNNAELLVRRMEVLLQKMDNDTDLSSTDYESSIKSIK